jgi:AraC-like DNA-binding protein
MRPIFEYDDVLNRPVEAFYFDTRKYPLPVEPHFHYFIEVIYMTEGEIEVICNEKAYILKPGDFIFMSPLAMHSIYRKSKEDCRYAVLKFSADRIRLHGDYLPRIGTIYQNPAMSKHLPIFFEKDSIPGFDPDLFTRKCIAEVTERKYGYDSILYAGISEFLVELLRYWHEHGYDSELKPFDNTGEYSVHSIILYISEHIGENISVNELAEMCHMSYSYFAKTFHKLYGQSCKEYMEFLRLTKAEKLLLFTDYDLNYISEETGFADCSHFIRVFKKKYEMTPKQFRKVNR